jgi:hypothetical protein
VVLGVEVLGETLSLGSGTRGVGDVALSESTTAGGVVSLSGSVAVFALTDAKMIIVTSSSANLVSLPSTSMSRESASAPTRVPETGSASRRLIATRRGDGSVFNVCANEPQAVIRMKMAVSSGRRMCFMIYPFK